MEIEEKAVKAGVCDKSKHTLCHVQFYSQGVVSPIKVLESSRGRGITTSIYEVLFYKEN